MPQEQILVVPSDFVSDLGLCTGFMSTVHNQFINRLLYGGQARFMPRKKMEGSVGFKQIIPYVVFTCGNKVFTYVRGKKSTESRLHGHRAIGIGGHINEGDAEGFPFWQDYFYQAYVNGMRREVREEVVVNYSTIKHVVGGIIFTDCTEVGKVHLGIMHHVTIRGYGDIRPNNHEITEPEFMTVDEMKSTPDLVDDWARLCLPYLARVIG
jgi:predicted NUDIX family phosphoesterase